MWLVRTLDNGCDSSSDVSRNFRERVKRVARAADVFPVRCIGYKEGQEASVKVRVVEWHLVPQTPTIFQGTLSCLHSVRHSQTVCLGRGSLCLLCLHSQASRRDRHLGRRARRHRLPIRLLVMPPTIERLRFPSRCRRERRPLRSAHRTALRPTADSS